MSTYTYAFSGLRSAATSMPEAATTAASNEPHARPPTDAVPVRRPARRRRSRSVLRSIAYVSTVNLSVDLVPIHLAGLRHWHIRCGREWCGRSERVRLTIRALARSHVSPRSTALTPASAGLLRRLRRRLRRAPLPAADCLAAWVAPTLGFFGAPQGSEYLQPALPSSHIAGAAYVATSPSATAAWS